MKSQSSMVIILVVLLVISGLVYVFVIRKPSTDTTQSGLVSTTTGGAQGLQNQASSSTTGSQVVQILRNLSVIKLDDRVFKNPAFAMLVDLSTAIPAATNPGRRNPFAPIGADGGTLAPDTFQVPSSGNPVVQ